MRDADRAATIGDYGLIGDCHTAALVWRDGSIDGCCLPRFDSGSAFGRLLDPSAGHCQIAPADPAYDATQRYIEDTLALETTFHGPAGAVTLSDCMAMPDAEGSCSDRRLMRVIEGRSGSVEMQIALAPRFDYGEVRPWIRQHGDHLYSVIGGNDALIVWSELPSKRIQSTSSATVRWSRPGRAFGCC